MGEPCHEEVLYLGEGAEPCRREYWMFRYRSLPFHPLLCFPFPSFSFFPTNTNINEKKKKKKKKGPKKRRNSLQSMHIIRIPPLRCVESQDDLFGAVVLWVG